MIDDQCTKIRATLLTPLERISRRQYQFNCLFDDKPHGPIACECHTTTYFAENHPAFDSEEFLVGSKVILTESDVRQFIHTLQPNLVWIDRIESGQPGALPSDL